MFEQVRSRLSRAESCKRHLIDLLREWQIRGFKLLETRAKNRFTQEV